MDSNQLKINHELEEALFKWEEERQSNKDLSLETFLQSYPAIREELELAIKKLQKMDWLQQPLPDQEAETLPKKDSTVPPIMPGKINSEITGEIANNIPGVDSPAGYRLVKKIGRGSFGEVWEARGPGEISLAMKIIPMNIGLDIVEIRSLNLFKTIRHPHLLSIFGFWIMNGQLWIAFELAEMNFLEYVTKTHPSETEILSMFTDAAQALDFLNQKRHVLEDGELVSILHRDVKPQNMLIVGGALKLGDFGLARILDEERNQHSGCMTPSYSPPEFFHEKMSHSSDQYSLAITYCQVRGGCMPFTGTSAEVMAGHCNRQPDLSMLPMHQQAVVAKALDKNPSNRWNSCSEFINQIKLANSNPVTTPTKKFNPLPALAILAAIALVTLGFLPFLKTPKITTSTPKNTSPNWDEVILSGHQGEVTCSHFSTDGKIAITGSNDKQAIVWDTLNKTEKFKLKQQTASVTAVAISHDGSMALTGGDFLDNMIVLWDLKNGTKIRELKGHEHRIRGLHFLPDGKRAISCSFDCTARLWDLDTGKQIQFFEKMDTYDPKNLRFGSPNQVWHMDVSEDGKTMVCCMRDGRICVHDVESGKRKNTFNGPDQFYKALSINQDASIAITAFGGQMLGMKDPYDLKIIRWNLASTSKEVLMETASLVETLHNPKGTNDLFIFPKKGQPFILDLKTKEKKNTLDHLDSLINCMSSVNDGSKIILGCKDFSVRLLNRD